MSSPLHPSSPTLPHSCPLLPDTTQPPSLLEVPGDPALIFPDYYLIPQRLTALIMGKILDSAVDEVSEALSVHVVPRAIQIVVVPTGVIVLLGLCNPPRSWTGMVGPFLPGFTIAPCLDSLLCCRLIKRPKSILQDSPKI
jgi:hypothetical protein